MNPTKPNQTPKTQNKNKEKKLYVREFHPIRDNDTILAFDIENMRVIELNDLELRILNNIKKKTLSVAELKKKFPPGKAAKVEEAVNELSHINMLDYSPFNALSLKETDDYNRKYLTYLQKKDLMQISLNVSHKCNLDCGYCYGEDGSYGGPPINMSKETAEQAIKFLMEASGNAENCRITIFGGEPLINYDLVKHIVAYAKRQASGHNKNMYFSMTTNGVLLDDDKIDFLVKEKIDLTFSFDGPKQIQDQNRPFKANKKKSSYDLIYPKILKCIEKAEKNKTFYCFRATMTRPGILNLFKVFDFFNGFKTGKIYYDYAESRNISTDGLAITGDTLESYRQKVREVADEFKKKGLTSNYSSLLAGPLKAIQQKKKRQRFCSSPGVTYVGVSAEGDLFPCHRFVGCKETKLGDVWKGYDRKKWLKRYAKVNIFNGKVCSACWLRYFCGGLCPATAYFLGGDFLLSEKVKPEPVHCKLSKILFEEALLLYASLSASNPETNTQSIHPSDPVLPQEP